MPLFSRGATNCLVVCMLLALQAPAFGLPGYGRGAPERQSLTEAPLNVVAMAGETIVLKCSVQEPPPASRILWSEYITYPGIELVISDNEVILQGRPNSDRYRIIHTSPTEYSLEIRNVRLGDGGRYSCQDAAATPSVFRGQAELIVIEETPKCVETVNVNGVVLEGQLHSVECHIKFQGQYIPQMNWWGPIPFTTEDIQQESNSVSSKIHYTVDRSMDLKAFVCLINFTDIGSTPAGVASNTPTWEYRYQTVPHFVYWAPKGMSASPLKTEYSVGDVIICYADAYPAPFYYWENKRTNQVVVDYQITVSENMVGYNQTLMCLAQNMILGVVYTETLDIPAYVPGQVKV